MASYGMVIDEERDTLNATGETPCWRLDSLTMAG